MSKSSLLLVPSGGLANRMRSIASAWNLCTKTDARLQVVWFQGWGMHSAFCDLFEPIHAEGLLLREATFWDYVINDRPRRHNLWLPWLPQQLFYKGGVIHELQVSAMRDQGFDFEAWLNGSKRYMSCYDEFGTFPDDLYARLFRPNKVVKQLIANYDSHFSEYVIGMHIRRTDNIDSIRMSPTELFIEKGRQELTLHPELTIFLATDSEEVKQQMQKEFGSHVVTSEHEASRDSVEGLREGLADMWTLAKTQIIYGSAGSSFSVMAARIGGCKLEILKS